MMMFKTLVLKVGNDPVMNERFAALKAGYRQRISATPFHSDVEADSRIAPEKALSVTLICANEEPATSGMCIRLKSSARPHSEGRSA